MGLQQFPKLVLKRLGPVVRFLLRDVFRHGVRLRRAYGECAVTVLPMEFAQGTSLRLHPFGGTCLDLFDDFRERTIFGEAKENVHVVARAANLDGRRILILQDRRKVGVHLVAHRR